MAPKYVTSFTISCPTKTNR